MMQTPIYFKEIYLKLNEIIEENECQFVFVLTDSHTQQFCLPILLDELKGDFEVFSFSIPAGEENKNLSSAASIWSKLAETRQSRKMLLLNLGGGMVTDLGGFVGASFMRGIDFINIPTSLLAMVDASVGGKTGVNLEQTKNLVGAFSWPKATLIDSQFLETLPKREFKSGLAEMFKHGLIQDKTHWKHLIAEKELSSKNIQPLIQASVQIKLNITEADPKEMGLRKILNFGHTMGHAIESECLSHEKQLLHGEAIAMGMLIEGILSHQKNDLSQEDLEEIYSNLLRYFEPMQFDENEVKALVHRMRFDKKNKFNQINFSLLNSIGQCDFDVFVAEKDILKAIDTYHQKLF